ncbi:MAG: SMC family ATPase [Acidimicrobiia bacterium]|nr:SMC family ATPase [Acidimicrobiia bacterium]
MRPVDLRLRNFRSYAGEHTFEFAERSLVGIVGPIGSGKSSILDAIVFALYGRTPRVATATKTLINQRSADASVALRFEVEGELWEAARSIRIKGASRHALYRYEDPELEPVEKLTLEGEVNERIIALLGLDYAAFERSVLLAQGRFAEFLQARPADRDRVLKGVFGHDRIDRMKAMAKDRRDAASLSLEKLSVRLERLDEIQARLEANTGELATARERLIALEKAAAAVAAIDLKRTEAQATVAGATKRLQALDEHAGRLPDHDVTARSLQDAAAAESRRRKLAEELDRSQQQLQDAERDLKVANDDGEPELLAEATSLLAAAEPQLKVVVEADRRVAAAQKRLEAAREDEASAHKRLEESETVRDHSLGRAAEAAKILEDAEVALERGRHADMAATLRAGLTSEDRCPVCEQLVTDVPAALGDTHLEELERVLVAARRTKADVDATHTAALTTLERTRQQVETAADGSAAAETQVVGAEEDAVRARGDLEETTIRLEKILGPGDPGEHLQRRREAYEALAQARDTAQRKVDQARGQHDQAIRDEQESAKALQELGRKLTDLAARLEIEIAVGDDAPSLGAALIRLREEWGRITAELRSELADAEETLAGLAGERAELLEGLEITGDVASAVAVVADRIARLESAIGADAAEVEKGEDLIAERAQLEERIRLFGRINSDLTDSRFIRFLLDEERVRLAELGSEHFQRLSAGRYRFADDQFAIVDLTAADVTRRAESLSGGETFLASLGLALALAELVAGTGGRLDAFFLDEGFGTLDPEHLDLAMEGIESLVAEESNRLVVIVSHVPELRDRIEDLIVLERSPVTGDTRVVTG